MTALFRHLGPSWREEVADAAAANVGVLGDTFFTTSDHRVRFTSSPGVSIIFELNNATETEALIVLEETNAFKDMITDSAGVESFITSVGATDTKLASFSNAVLLAMIAASHTNSDTGTNSLTYEINTTGFKVTLDTANIPANLIFDLNRLFRHIEAIIPVQDHESIMFSITDETSPSQINAFFPFLISATSFFFQFTPTVISNDPFKAYNDSNVDEDDCWLSAQDPAGVPQALALDFNFGNEKRIDRYRFLTRNTGGQQNEPQDWTFSGSNATSPDINADGEWTELDSRTGEPDLGQNTLSALFDFTNAISFRHYRFKFTQSNGNRVAIANMQLFDSATQLVDQPALFQSSNLSNPVPHLYDKTQDKIFSLLDGVEVT